MRPSTEHLDVWQYVEATATLRHERRLLPSAVLAPAGAGQAGTNGASASAGAGAGGSSGKGEWTSTVTLACEAVRDGAEVLIFCATKAKTVQCADALARAFEAAQPEAALVTPARMVARLTLLERLHAASPTARTLELYKRTVPHGVALHHAGLGLDEKSAIEEAFRKRTLRVLCATTTLAAGVNLPARRVILPSPYDQAGVLLQPISYRQMAGRAGRAGLCELGEVFVVAGARDRDKVGALMASPMTKLTSLLLGRHPPPRAPIALKAATSAPPPSEALPPSEAPAPPPPPQPVRPAAEPEPAPPLWRHPTACQRFILEAVASGIASTPEELQQLAQLTFAAALCAEPATSNVPELPAPSDAPASAAEAAGGGAAAAAAAGRAERLELRRALHANLDAACHWLRRPYVDASTAAERQQQRSRPLLRLFQSADGMRWAPTPFGKAVYLGSLRPSDGVYLLHTLRQVLKRFVEWHL